jgi:hypothetical protein
MHITIANLMRGAIAQQLNLGKKLSEESQGASPIQGYQGCRGG